MIDGVYHNPTRVLFGRGAELKVGEEVAKHSKNILLHYGRESFKKYGLRDKVAGALEARGVRYVELGGVRPNPGADLVYEGIELCRKEGLDFILAVGGGSVIDSAKAISAGAPYPGDFFELFERKAAPEKALKVGTVLTIPGSGSESSAAAVITHEERRLKKDCESPLLAPVFSILNPELTLTVPVRDTACGIADAVSHVLERYFTPTTHVDCTDRICEGLLRTLMKYGALVLENPGDYDARAEIMWACKLAHDNTAGFGRKQDWSCHRIGHELGAFYDVPHGAAMAVLFPAWMRHVRQAGGGRFEQFARRVFDVPSASAGAAAGEGIESAARFFGALGLPVSLRGLGVPDTKRFAGIAESCVSGMRSGTIGNFARLRPGDIVSILEKAF